MNIKLNSLNISKDSILALCSFFAIIFALLAVWTTQFNEPIKFGLSSVVFAVSSYLIRYF